MSHRFKPPKKLNGYLNFKYRGAGGKMIALARRIQNQAQLDSIIAEAEATGKPPAAITMFLEVIKPHLSFVPAERTEGDAPVASPIALSE